MRRDDALLSLLHLCDSLFPIGSFAYSDGLESAAAGGRVTGPADLAAWLEISLQEGFGRSDGPAIVAVWPAVDAADWEAVAAIDDELTALRASSTARLANRSMGLRLLKTMREREFTQPVIFYHGTFGSVKRSAIAISAKAAGAFGEAVHPGELMGLVLEALE